LLKAALRGEKIKIAEKAALTAARGGSGLVSGAVYSSTAIQRLRTNQRKKSGSAPVSHEDFIKMMAIANNPERSIKDKADLSAFIQLFQNRLFPDYFEPLDMNRIYPFADRFGQRKLIEKYLDQTSKNEGENGSFKL